MTDEDGNPAYQTGIPPGGTTNQVLAKQSDGDGDVGWATETDIDHGLPAGGTTSQILTKASNTDYDVEWATDTDADADDWTVAATQTASFAAADRTVYPIDATAGALAVTIPHTPAGLQIRLVRLDAVFAHPVTVAMDSGSLLAGGGAYGSITLNTSGAVMDVAATGTDGIVLSPVIYGGDATIRNLTVGVNGSGLLEVTDDFQHSGDAFSVFGAALAAKHTVTGAKADAVAASILAALVAYGFVNDTTT